MARITATRAPLQAKAPPARLRRGGAEGQRRSARIRDRAAAAKAESASKAAEVPVRITKLKPQRERYDCTTCDRNLASSQFPKYAITDNCKHRINTCKACLKEWISMSLQHNMFDQLACPECPEKMQNDEVKTHAVKEDYERYDELERKAIADRIPGWRWCMGLRCRSGQVHPPPVNRDVELESTIATLLKGQKIKGPGKGTIAKDSNSNDDLNFTCNSCGAQACVACDRPSHDNETCVEHQARIAKEDEMSVALIAEVAKKCPSCSVNIQRNGGCDHIICRNCNDAFCWLCLVNYKVINVSGHGKDCVYAQPGRIDPHGANPMQALNAVQNAMQNNIGLFNGIFDGIGRPEAANAA